MKVSRSQFAFLAALLVVVAAWLAYDLREVRAPPRSSTSDGDHPSSTIPAPSNRSGVEDESHTSDARPEVDSIESTNVPDYLRADRSGYSVTVFEKPYEFPDGERILIRFRPTISDAQLSPELDNQRDPGFFDRLLPEVEQGNGIAAYRLYKSLVECSDAPRTEGELADYLNQMDQTFTHPDPTSELGARHLDVDEDLSVHKSKVMAKFSRCAGVTTEMLGNAGEYLKVAAETNVTGATLDYARSIGTSNPELAASYYDKAWQLGDVGGAYELGRMYRDGTIGSNPDPVKGYAYLYVANVVGVTLFEGLDGPAYDIVRADMGQKFDEEVKSIRPGDRELAMTIAKRFLKEHPNCCTY